MEPTVNIVPDRPSRGRTRRKPAPLSPRELRRLLQLGICLVVFLMVFIGRGVFPARMTAMRENLLRVITTDTDFKTAFADLGRSIRARVPVFGAMEDLWQQVFGGGAEPEAVPSEGLPAYLTGRASTEPIVTTPLRTPDLPMTEIKGEVEGSPDPAADVVPEAEAGAEPEAESAPPTGKPAPDTGELPEKVTLEQVSLDLSETVTPVMGVISSAYGYRDHPVDGAYSFHYGVDIFTDKGVPVVAFADGVVDFIGESPVYGLYIQLRHAEDVTTFYAHCDTLLLGQGKSVKAGQQIATVGESGNATGPHLHLEVRKDNIFCDPAHYIETR